MMTARGGGGFARERLWYRDDISPTQRRALTAMRGMPKGGGTTEQLLREARISLSTLRGLERYGLVKSHITPIEHGCMVVMTQSGRDAL
jgi:hypothetical protein